MIRSMIGEIRERRCFGCGSCVGDFGFEDVSLVLPPPRACIYIYVMETYYIHFHLNRFQDLQTKLLIKKDSSA